MLAPLDNPTIFVKEVVPHHLSFQKLIKEPSPISIINFHFDFNIIIFYLLYLVFFLEI